jgi:hypothetical protein
MGKTAVRLAFALLLLVGMRGTALAGLDFPGTTLIAVNSETSYWGPFSFNFAAVVPPGDSLTSVSATSSFLPAVVDSSAALISAGSVIVSGNSVALRLQYPGAAFIGSHELIFMLRFASGAQQGVKFGYVVVTQ